MSVRYLAVGLVGLSGIAAWNRPATSKPARDITRFDLNPTSIAIVDRVRETFRVGSAELDPRRPHEMTNSKKMHPVLGPGTVRRIRKKGASIVPELPRTKEEALASVTLPKTADGFLSITDNRSNSTVRARLLDAAPVEAKLADGIVVYDDAFPNGTVLHRVHGNGTEDYVFITSRSRSSLSYEVELGHGIAALRSIANALEFLDGNGEPKLRISPPWVVDANAKVHEAKLAVLDCAADTNPRAPWGRPITPPGKRRCLVSVSWDATNATYPILVDPSWSTTGTMGSRRAYFTAKYASGSSGSYARVLVAGGLDYTVPAALSSAELYCVANGCTPGTWAYTGSMSTARAGHVMIRLTELDGAAGTSSVPSQQMVIGGLNSGGHLASSEVYSESSGTWSSGPSMSTARSLAAIARYDQGKAMVVGGYNSGGILGSAESLLFGTSFSSLPSMGTERVLHTATALYTTAPGSAYQTPVLVAGGYDNSGTIVDPARRYEPSTNSWVNAGAMNLKVFNHTATQVLAGTYQYDVFVGGGNGGSNSQRTLQRYRRSDATWYYVGAVDWREGHTATLLGDNQTILFAGGYVTYSGETTSAWAFNTNSGSTSTSTMNQARQIHNAVAISSSTPYKVLLMGGVASSTSLDVAEIYSH